MVGRIVLSRLASDPEIERLNRSFRTSNACLWRAIRRGMIAPGLFLGKRPANYRIDPTGLRSSIFKLKGSSAAMASGVLAVGRCSK